MGLDPTLAIRLVDGLLEYGLPRERMVEVLAFEFGMREPSSDDEFWSLISAARGRIEQDGGGSRRVPSDYAVHRVLVNVMRRQAGVRIIVPRSRHPARLRKAHHLPTDGWRPGDPPDYSRLRRYEASAEELLVAGSESVDGLVEKVNRLLARAGKAPVTQGDFPASRRKFFALVARLARLRAVLRGRGGRLRSRGIRSAQGSKGQDMEAQQRLDRIARHLAEQFSCGMGSVSVDDEVEDGVLLSNEIEAVLRSPLARSADGGISDVVEALTTISEVWGSGYELARGDDFVTDDETVEEIVCAYADTLAEAPARP